MSVAKVTEITASSPTGFEEAAREGIARANKTIENVAGAWISEQKVEVRDARIVNYRVTMRVTFVLKDED